MGSSASVMIAETTIDMVTATANRWQSRFATFVRKSIGMKMVYNMSDTVTSVLSRSFTVPPAVLQGERRLLPTTWLMPLIIMTVLLIMTLTVRTSFSSASTPSEKLKMSTMLKALTSETGIVMTGTSAVC